MIGKFLVFISFALACGSAYFFFSANNNEKRIKNARFLFYLASFGILLSSALLLVNILNHNFQYTYIYSYSSKDLPFSLLLSSFWAGQEGSFLLWALFTAIVGVVFIKSIKGKSLEALAMAVYSLVFAFMIVILIAKSPFDYVWESFAGNNVKFGYTPEDGRGLNPILENIWIIIHPPILFIGYALLAVPYSIAFASLFKNDYEEWNDLALPWTNASAAVLGLGIMLGGFWAYETLGWGGFWGWDPVENSSLVPWMLVLALAHTQLVQKKSGGMRKTNYILAILTFVFVIYSTFLTRSGILSDVSVHSFIDPGKVVYSILFAFLLLFFLAGITIFFIRFKNIPKTGSTYKLSSRSFLIVFGTIVILISTFIIAYGTSFPIITSLVGTLQSMEISFYDKMNFPFIILMMILNGISLFFAWNGNFNKKQIKQIVFLSAFSIVLTAFLIFIALDQWAYIVLAFSAILSITLNIFIMFKKIRRKSFRIAAYLSHIGVALLFLGVIGSAGYSSSEHLVLRPKENGEKLGYKITFKGKTQIEKGKKDREKFTYNLELEKKGKRFELHPIVSWSSYNDWQFPFFEPSIRTSLLEDIYISPKSVLNDTSFQRVTLLENEAAICPADSSLQIKLISLDTSKMDIMPDEFRKVFASIVEFQMPSQVIRDTLYSVLNLEKDSFSPIWYSILGTSLKIGLVECNFENGSFQATFKFASELFTFEVAKKPFINLVWLGTIAVVTGFFFAMSSHLSGKSNRKKI